MTVAITRTKIRIPQRRDDFLSRPRLDNLFNDLLDYPFTLISAPAGYGKTSLMIDLAHQASFPACWFSIDPLDKDPKRFLGHLIHSIKLHFPGFGSSSLDLLNNLTDPLKESNQFIRTLINDIYLSISENFVVFIDDFHLLGEHGEIFNFISHFGQQMDENTHLVLSSRILFSFPDLPLLVSRRQIKGVNQEDLAFLPEELNDYLIFIGQQPLSSDKATKLIGITSGWITGLLFRELKDNSPILLQNNALKVTGANLDSYFLDEIIIKQPNHVRKLLFQTSIFEEFNIAICEDVLGLPDQIKWKDFFDELINKNLFIDQVEDDSLYIRYHHLFRDFLRKTFKNNHNEEANILLYRLTNYFIEKQDWERAFVAAHQSGNPHKMAEIIELAFGIMFHEGRIKLLANWLKILPEAGYSTYPILHSLKGFTYTELGNPSLGREEITKAIEIDHIKSSPELLSKSLIWRSTANRLLGNYHEGLSDSFQANRVISKEIHFQHIKAEAYREIGLGYGRIGNNNKAIHFLNKASRIYKIENKSSNLAQVHMDIGNALMSMGKFSKAEDYFIKSIPHWTSQSNNIQLSIIMNNLGYLSSLTGNYQNAANYLNQGEEYAKRVSSPRLQAFITTTRGDLAQAIGLFINSIQNYEQANLLIKANPDSFLSIYIPIAKATSYRYLFKFEEALSFLTNLEEQIHFSSSEYEFGLWLLEWGFLHINTNDLASAYKSFQASYEIFSGISRPFELLKSILGICLVLYRNKEQGPLSQYLTDLHINLAEVETIEPLLRELSFHQDSINQLVTDFPNHTTLKNFLVEINLYLEKLHAIQERINPQPKYNRKDIGLEIRGFGKSSVHKAGEAINTSEWVHQKTVRELFYYLLAHPYGVAKEQIGLAFWPESSPSQLNCQFKNAIYRLRRAIGKDYIVYQKYHRNYSFNWECKYSYDVKRFQDICEKANNPSMRSNRFDLLHQAVAIYQHPFCPELEGIWVLPIRQKLYLDYETAQLRIATYELSIGNFTACRDACLAVLDIEPCQEEAYQLCMRAYSGLDNMTGIRRLFIQYKNNLRNILGATPSTSIIDLFIDLSNN